MDTVWIVFSVVASFVVIGLTAWWFEKKRREAMERVAAQIGLTYHGRDRKAIEATLGGLPLFQRGRSRQFHNVMSGSIGDIQAFLFDYCYTTGSGKNASTHSQTVAAYRMSGEVPAFQLRPESMWHRIGAVMGFDDIDLDEHPRFSKRFLLKGRDEAAVRTLFTDEVVAAVSPHERICLEGGGDWIAVYRASKRSKPEQIPGFLDLSFTIVNVMAPA